MFERVFNTVRFANRALGPGRDATGGPFKLNLMVTTRCNQRCRHCGIWSRKDRDLPPDIIKNLLQTSPRLSWIDVTGGEIFLHPGIEDIFETILTECRDLAVLHFPTNGTKPEDVVRITRDILSRKGPRLVVTVSIDGPPKVHHAVRGMDDCFQSALETYIRLKEIRGCHVYLGMTITSENLGRYSDTLESVRRQAAWVGPSDLHVNLPNPSSHYYGNIPGDLPDRSALTGEIHGILAARSGNGLRPLDLIEKRYLNLALEYLQEKAHPLPCRALKASCFVDASGTVFPCIMWDKPLGSILGKGSSLQSIWDSKEAGYARQCIEDRTCPGCWTPCEAVPTILANWFPNFAPVREKTRTIPGKA